MRHALAFLFCALLFSLKAFSCEMASPVRHTNPDGTQGGLVSKGAKVEASVFIGFNARVCDQAWADGNAKILDNAIVSENAWVRENSIIKEHAVVSGEAVVWGGLHSPALVSGFSRVYGNARILAGTSISEYAKVFGSVSLEDSQVYGQAEVCLGAYIKEEEINSNYFCTALDNSSKESFALINFDEKKINSLQDRILIESTNDLSEDTRFFGVTINGESLPIENIEVFRNRLSLGHQNLLRDGLNTISVSGRDKYHKEIEVQTFTLVVGSLEKTILLSSVPVLAAKASAIIHGVDYELPVRIIANGIKLTSLPVDAGKFNIKLNILSQDAYLTENYFSDDLPDAVELSPIPKFTNNITAIGSDLNSWTISDPNRVEVLTDGVKLSFAGEELVLIKTFQLSASESSLSFGLSAIEAASLFDSSLEVEVTYLSRGSRKIQSKTMLLSELAQVSTALKSFSIGYTKNSERSEDVTFAIRLRSLIAGAAIPQEIQLGNGKKKTVDMSFIPQTMSVLNKKTAPVNLLARNKSYPLPDVDCSSGSYSVANTTAFLPNIEDIKFLSAGVPYSLVKYKENRIYGRLSFKKLKREEIEEIRLVIWQYDPRLNEPRLVTARLSPCQLKRFEDADAGSAISFVTEKDISRPLFAIPSLDLMNFDTSPGQKVVIYTEADIHTSTGIETIESDPLALTVLKSPFGGPELTYGTEEDYDSAAKEIVRTGGDKWILPAYAQMLTDIVLNGSQLPYFWDYGDLAKLNGGTFLGHREHTDGRDADVKFRKIDVPGVGKVEFNYPELRTDDQWREFLNAFENFLIRMKEKYKFIQDIYLTRVDKNIDGSKWLNIRFANRCFEDMRLIQFERAKREGSLVMDMPGHWHHAHIKFNEVDEATGKAAEYSLDAKPTDDLDNFFFELDSNGENLKITPQSSDQLKDKYIAWRFQDIDGYDDFTMKVELGPKTISGKKATAQISKLSNLPKRFIKLTIAYRKSGACVQRNIEIDPTLAAKYRKWTFEGSAEKSSWQMVKVK